MITPLHTDTLLFADADRLLPRAAITNIGLVDD